VYYYYCICHAPFILSIDNYIDGTALLALQNDFEEFKNLVPQSGLRMRIKSVISNRAFSFENENVMMSLDQVC